MSDEKIYLNSLSIKEHVFDGGGSVLNVGVSVQKMIEELGQYGNERGFMNIAIKKRKNPDQYGRTHYATLNNYEKKEDDSTSDGNPF